MMLKKLIFLVALATLSAACDPYKHDSTVFVELKKDPCFGLCPVYTFKVDGKGNASFKGIRNLEKIGNWNRKLSPAETNALFAQILDAQLHQFEDAYNNAQVVDLPTTWLSFHDGSITKTIMDRYGAPEALKNLEKLLETVAEQNEGWVKIED